MDEELDTAKRATAQAMANEDRLRARILLHEKEAAQWDDAGRRSLKKGAHDDGSGTVRLATRDLLHFSGS